SVHLPCTHRYDVGGSIELLVHHVIAIEADSPSSSIPLPSFTVALILRSVELRPRSRPTAHHGTASDDLDHCCDAGAEIPRHNAASEPCTTAS
ncbi:hypothetical protein BHM03_00042613, partial [Ensete ventricosum]